MAASFTYLYRRRLSLGVAVATLAAVLAACAPAKPASRPGAGASGATDYAAPPQLSEAVRAGDSVQIAGTAAPRARIRLTASDGQALGATALDDGRWSLVLPAARPGIYVLAQDVAGRMVRARGHLVVLPRPGQPVVLLRPGAGAWAANARGRLTVTSVDFDSAGAAIVSGTAPPESAVRLVLDGAPAGEARVGAAGRFAAGLTGPLAPGAHAVTVEAGAATAGLAFDAARAGAAPAPFAAVRESGLWRLDWQAAGGGMQTTLVIDPAGEGG